MGIAKKTEQSSCSNSLSELSSRIQKEFGEGTVAGIQPNVDFFSTGCLSLDNALGGGIPQGRVIEVYGAESSGKSTIALTIASEIQKTTGRACGYIDTEQAMDLKYAQAIGIDFSKDKWILTQPDCAEDALSILIMMLETSNVGVVVLDSVAALVSKAVIQGDVGDAKMALNARLLSTQLPIIISKCRKNNVSVILINQIRDNVGVLYGDKTVTPGGKAIKFYASQRMQVSRVGIDKEGDKASAIKTKIVVKKNKVAPPYGETILTLNFGKGIDKDLDVFEMAVLKDIIHKSGSWFSYEDVKLGQGAENTIMVLRDNPDIFDVIKQKVKDDTE